MPQVIKDDQIPSVVDEWKLYQHQEIQEDWYKTDETRSTHIDHYLAKVFEKKTLSGTEMFPYLKKLIKAVLTLSHGNAMLKGVSQQAGNWNKQDTFDSRVTEWHQTSEICSGC